MNSMFPILAVETSGDLCSVAIMKNESVYIESNHLEKHVHSQKLMEMIDYVIKQANVGIKEIGSLAVSMGPGSFTGLRIGMAAVKGMAFGANIGIVPVPTFEAYALQLSAVLPPKTKFNIIIKASIDDVYFAKYLSADSGMGTLNPLQLLESSELTKNIFPDEQNFGNIIHHEIKVHNIPVTGSAIGRWAYLFGKDLLTFDHDNLEPNYLKQFVGKVKK